jgi:peptidoglycan pentaglycine glycine transferase (the first glycine)
VAVRLLDAGLEWRDNVPVQAWDYALVGLRGHPLQSALWGDARRKVDGMDDRRWMATRNGEAVWLARIERRRVPGGWIGWMPRGPTGDVSSGPDFPALVQQALRKEGVVLLVTDQWAERPAVAHNRQAGRPRTIWIDLSCGSEALWKNLDKQWRYGVGRAHRLGVTVDVAAGAGEIARFAALCNTVAENKGFRLPGSAALMEELLRQAGGDVEARLFLAHFEGAMSAGAFVIRCGRSLHYIWGAIDRSMAQVRAGEAVQWAAIEWAIAQGCTRYDLEGIDPEENLGTYAFKKKMGGREVTLYGKQYYPLSANGRLMAWLSELRVNG